METWERIVPIAKLLESAFASKGIPRFGKINKGAEVKRCFKA